MVCLKESVIKKLRTGATLALTVEEKSFILEQISLNEHFEKQNNKGGFSVDNGVSEKDLYKPETEEINIKEIVALTKKISPKSFVNKSNELIIEPKHNIYFRLEDVKSKLDFKCKVLAWLSRPSIKGVSDYWQKKILQIVNELLGTDFTKDDMCEIYTSLGNDCNRKLCEAFIRSGYDLSLLKKS